MNREMTEWLRLVVLKSSSCLPPGRLFQQVCKNCQRYSSVAAKARCICHKPHQHTSVAQGRFLGGSGHRAVAQMRPVVPKMPQALLASSGTGDKPNPSKGGLSLGGRPPEARGISSDETHPNELRSMQYSWPKRVPPTGKNAPLWECAAGTVTH